MILLTDKTAIVTGASSGIGRPIAPGKITVGAPGRPSDPAPLDDARRRTTWPRPGRPQEFADANPLLARNFAAFVTSRSRVVDDGWLPR